MRKLEIYVKKYGPIAGPKLYHVLQSQAAHAGVSARLRKKIDMLTGREARPESRRGSGLLPLFPEPVVGEVDPTPAGELVEVG